MDPDQEAAQRVGSTLCNKWTLTRLIGTGGMAAVYVADHKIGRREAIKILHADVAHDPELRARFAQEARAVNHFRHPGVVEIRDVDVTDDGAPFLVMELLEGEPLGAWARRPEGVPLPDLLRLVDELLDVLAAAHARGIVHRDIKPDNLFVTHEGRLKVLDFGIARVRADAAGTALRTRLGATLGTAPYMPPEQILGQEIDARADLFAVGATMFRLIARRRVHEAANETETLVKMASEPAPPLATVVPDAPPDVCVVVDRALMFDRAQRYPDAVTMQGDVRALRAGQPPPFAHGRLLDTGTPAPSALRVPSVALPATTGPGTEWIPPSHAPVTGDAPTAFGAGPHPGALEPTAAASPNAFGPPSAGYGYPGGPVSAAPATAMTAATPTADMSTLPRGPQAAFPMGPQAAFPMGPQAAFPMGPQAAFPMGPYPPAGRDEATPPSAGVMRPPGANTTLRSELPHAAVRPHGYPMPTGALDVQAPPSHASAPYTLPAGAQPLPPGATIPVVSAPPASLDGNTVLLVLVGVLFAALGVGLTLFFMLRGSGDKTAPDPSATAADTNEPVDPWPNRPVRSPSPPAPGGANLGPAQPSHDGPGNAPRPRPAPQPPPPPQPQPQQPPQIAPFPGLPGVPIPGASPAPQPQQPGKGKSKGKGKGHKD